MKIYETIKEDLKQSRLSKNSKLTLILSTLLGNLASNAKMIDGVKTVSDEDAIAGVAKHLKGLNETLDYAKEKDQIESIKYEISVLNEYTPSQLTTDEIRGILTTNKETGKLATMPDAMKFLKSEYTGKYDGKAASSIAKEVFS